MNPRLTCYYCGRGCQILSHAHYRCTNPNDVYTKDHVFPKHERAEMKLMLGWRRSQVYYTLPACSECNHKRGCKNFLEFMGAKITLDNTPKLVYSF